jgi:opacity protein-like surface antigen
MSKTMIAALAAVAVAGALIPSGARGDGFFVGTRAGRSSVESYPFGSRADIAGFFGGYRWGRYGIEAGFTDLGSMRRGLDVAINDAPAAGAVETEIEGYTLGANARFELSEHWSTTLRAGVVAWESDSATFIQGARVAAADESGSDWYAGLGLSYALSSRVDIGLQYERLELDLGLFDSSADLVTIQAELRF